MKYTDHWSDYWREYEMKRPNARMNTKFQCSLNLLPQDMEALLDIGGGNGLFTEMVKEKKQEINCTVLEGSAVAVRRCKEKNIKAILHDFDENLLPFDDDSFDVVTCLDVMEHLHHPWPLLEEMKRVSNRDIIISCPNFASIVNRLDVLFGRPPRYMADKYGNQTHGGHIQFITFNSLKYQIKKRGLKMEEYAVQETLFGKHVPLVRELRKLFPNIFGTICIRARKV